MNATTRSVRERSHPKYPRFHSRTRGFPLHVAVHAVGAHEWSQEPHPEELEAYADRVVDLCTDLAPNLHGAVGSRVPGRPPKVARIFSLDGGMI